MDELTIEEFTTPFDVHEVIVICEDSYGNSFYDGTIEHLFTTNDHDTLNMKVTRALVQENKLHIIAHY